MNKKLERIASDLARARSKRAEWDQKVADLEQKYQEEENTEIHEIVHAFSLTPEELYEFLDSRKGKMPGTADKKEEPADEA